MDHPLARLSCLSLTLVLLLIPAVALAQGGPGNLGRGQGGQGGGPPAAGQAANPGGERPAGAGERQAGAGGNVFALYPPTSTTRHTITVNGNTLAYKAEAGTLPLRDAKGETTAQIFYVADTADPAPSGRPLTFVFNGGPGAASAYLQLGAIGPRVMVTSERGEILPPPQRLVDNPDTWLETTDLVFVDPVGTGYSRGADPNAENQFWGVKQDSDAMSAFIRLYLERNQRMGAPIFLAGESYGGFRAALLAGRLPAESGIAVSGAVLISPALEFSLIFNADSFDLLPWALELPSMAAVNLEHQGVHGRTELAAGLREVEHFALGDYLLGLADEVTAGGAAVGARVATFTGLAPDIVGRQNGRVPVGTFVREFARSSGQVLSRYDGTIAGPDPGNARGADPVLDRATTALSAAFVQYAQEELGYKTEISYRLLNGDISRRWDYGTTPSRQGYAGVLDDLQAARTHNPALQVMIAQGFTDLVTPYLVGTYLIKHLPPLAGAAPIDVEDYPGGHMMYLRPDSRHALQQDALALYRRALSLPDKH